MHNINCDSCLYGAGCWGATIVVDVLNGFAGTFLVLTTYVCVRSELLPLAYCAPVGRAGGPEWKVLKSFLDVIDADGKHLFFSGVC